MKNTMSGAAGASVLALLLAPGTAKAEAAQPIDVPAQPLEQALAELSRETGLSILADKTLLDGKQSNAVRGVMHPQEALSALLADTRLNPRALERDRAVVTATEVVSQNATEDAMELSEIVFRTTRGRVPIEDVPRNATVIPQETFETLKNGSTNLVETLPKIIPSYGPPQFRNSTRGVTLRGRSPLYLLDGIPLSTQVIQTLGFLDQNAIDSVEILYGPTALYGNGAAGGVIQFFTLEPSDAALETDLSFGIRSSLSDGSSFESDSFSYLTTARVSGTRGDLGFVAGLSLERTNGFYQPGGERLGPGGLDDFENIGVFGKLTYDLDSTQRLEGFVSIVEREAHATEYAGVAESAAPFETIGVFDPSSYAEPPNQSGQYFSLKYLNSDLGGGDFSLQAYYADETTVDIGADIRGSPLPPSFPTLFQTQSDLESYGIRTDYAFSASDALRFQLGGDYRMERKRSPLLVSSEAAFDPDNFFDASRSLEQFPDIDIESFGLFLQAAYDVNDRLTVEGGLRYDRFDYDVAPSDPAFALPTGIRPGGSGDADDVTFNLGATFDLNADTTLFASFAQGFSIPFIDFAVTTVAPGVGVSDTSLIDPIKVDSYEIGIRGSRGILDYAFAVFYAESDFGSSIQVNPDGTAQLIRAPQRNYGFELATQAQVRDDLSLSFGLAYNDGENDADDDGDFEALPSLQVLPLTISLGARWEYSDRLSFNGNVYYLSGRDRAFDDGVDSYELDGFTTVDVGLDYEVGQGRMSLQITNLFDEFYLPPESQSRVGLTNDRRTAGQGRALSLVYSTTF